MTHRRTNPQVFSHSYELRHNQTEAEGKLWVLLRSHRLNGVHFRRQHAIGPYVVDFCAPREKLVVEVDGGQHLEQQEYDAERTNYLGSKGYRVIRFWNGEVMDNIESVASVIIDMLAFMVRDHTH
jgi:very-short-patch-repair endonuclease